MEDLERSRGSNRVSIFKQMAMIKSSRNLSTPKITSDDNITYTAKEK